MLEKVLLIAALGYLAFNLWNLTEVFYPKQCVEPDECINPKWNTYDNFSMTLTFKGVKENLIVDKFIVKSFNVADEMFKSVFISVPLEIFNNGSMICNIFISDKNGSNIYEKNVYLTSYRVPKFKSSILLGSSNTTGSYSENYTQPVTHRLSTLFVGVLNNPIRFYLNKLPTEIHSIISIKMQGSSYQYSPIFHINPELQSTADWIEATETDLSIDKKMDLKIIISSLSIGKLRLRCMLEQASHNLKTMGFKDKDIEDVRSIFTDSNIYILLATIIISTLHLCFDFLAFKNDVSFWRRTKSTAGLSTRVIIWRCFSCTIIFLYLLDEKSSLLIVVPAGVSIAIEFWKLTRIAKIGFSLRSGFSVGCRNAAEKVTDELDSRFMRRLILLMTPLCIGGSVYSLIYIPHRSWYSWTLDTVVNGVYAFGFLLMTPQLFINYRLKSVANLPWRALTYKAFNTFIDDFFAFIIKMPTAHRIACFRDDIVFIIYLYQRWLYPVDGSRIDEYAEEVDAETVSSKLKQA